MRLFRRWRALAPEVKFGLLAVPIGLCQYFYFGHRLGLLAAGFGVFLIAYWWLWERRRKGGSNTDRMA